jgi:hypothetical protein
VSEADRRIVEDPKETNEWEDAKSQTDDKMFEDSGESEKSEDDDK